MFLVLFVNTVCWSHAAGGYLLRLLIGGVWIFLLASSVDAKKMLCAGVVR